LIPLSDRSRAWTFLLRSGSNFTNYYRRVSDYRVMGFHDRFSTPRLKVRQEYNRKTWRSWIRALWYNYENNQLDALYRLIYYYKSALHVSGDVFAHHQVHLTVFTVSGIVHLICCWLAAGSNLGGQYQIL